MKITYSLKDGKDFVEMNAQEFAKLVTEHVILKERVNILEAALKPFADVAQDIIDSGGYKIEDDVKIAWWTHTHATMLDFKKALGAIKPAILGVLDVTKDADDDKVII